MYSHDKFSILLCTRAAGFNKSFIVEHEMDVFPIVNRVI